MNHAIIVKLFHLFTQLPRYFAYLTGKSWLFYYCVLYSYMYLLTYLLTDEFLVDNIYSSSINNTYKLIFLLEGLECFKDTRMEACSTVRNPHQADMAWIILASIIALNSIKIGLM